MGNAFSQSTSLNILAENSENNKAIIKELEANPHLITGKDEDGNTLMHRACKGGNKKLVERLVILGADINAANHAGLTPLHFACWEGHEAIVVYLLGLNINVNARDNNGCTALHFACDGGHGSVAILLLSSVEPSPIDRDARDLGGWTALHEACRRGSYELARVLIMLGSDATILNNDGYPALHYCSDAAAKEVLMNVERMTNASPLPPRPIAKAFNTPAVDVADPECGASSSWTSASNDPKIQMHQIV